MLTLGVALASAVVGYLAGVVSTCWALDDIAEDEAEDTAHTAMTAPPQVHFTGQHPIVTTPKLPDLAAADDRKLSPYVARVLRQHVESTKKHKT